jgi:hypothetical protein
VWVKRRTTDYTDTITVKVDLWFSDRLKQMDVNVINEQEYESKSQICGIG